MLTYETQTFFVFSEDSLTWKTSFRVVPCFTFRCSRQRGLVQHRDGPSHGRGGRRDGREGSSARKSCATDVISTFQTPAKVPAKCHPMLVIIAKCHPILVIMVRPGRHPTCSFDRALGSTNVAMFPPAPDHCPQSRKRSPQRAPQVW